MVFNSSEMENTEEESRWVHSDAELLSGHGVIYNVNVIPLIYLFFITY